MNVRSSLMAVNIHITIIELNALHTKRQNLFQELDAVIHLLMEAKHWGWIATDRSRARRCVEACVYGTLDFVGYPRFPAPVEFIAAVIAYYVHPVNIQTACLIMEGAEFTENIINGVERPVKAAELFAFTLRVRAGNTDVLTDAEENVRQKLRAEGV